MVAQKSASERNAFLAEVTGTILAGLFVVMGARSDQTILPMRTRPGSITTKVP